MTLVTLAATRTEEETEVSGDWLYQLPTSPLFIHVETPSVTTKVEHTSAQDHDSIWERAAALFERWREGDPAAFDALVRLLTPVLWHVLRAYRLDREAAEDTLQGVWLALVRQADHIEDPAAIGGWLVLTARRSAWRAAKPARAVSVADEIFDGWVGTEELPEASVERAWEAAALWRAVATLTERCQHLLRILAFSDRPDYARLSAELAMPVGSIGPTRARCLAKLRTQLAKGQPS